MTFKEEEEDEGGRARGERAFGPFGLMPQDAAHWALPHHDFVH